MAYQTGTAANQAALMEALHDFAVAEGWSSDIFSSGDSWMAINNGSVFVQFRWNNNNVIVPFCSTAFSGTGVAPGNHTGDDGCGNVDGTAPYTGAATSQRRIDIPNGPYTAYHFFTNDTTQYIHVVVEYQPGRFRHWSFGTLDKVGAWVGGQYMAHTWWGNAETNPQDTINRFLWDGLATITGTGATATNHYRNSASVRVENMPDQSGSQQWMILNNSITQTVSADRAGQNHVRGFGGCRSGPLLASLGRLPTNLLNAYVPLIPIPIFWSDQSSSPNQAMLLGYAPGAAQISLAGINPNQEFTVGGETWQCFPMIRKATDGEQSRNGGMAYLKVV